MRFSVWALSLFGLLFILVYHMCCCQYLARAAVTLLAALPGLIFVYN